MGALLVTHAAMQNVDKIKEVIMKFSPRNRHLLVEVIEEEPKEKSKSSILLPEDYKPKDSAHSYVRIRDLSPDCTINISKSDMALVETRMLTELEVGEKAYHLILENYVLGVVTRR